MQRYEFKVVPAPRRGDKVRGVKTTEDRFALTLAEVMNAQGRDGWDYVRADTLPCDERVGLTGTKTTFQNMLVFRRILEVDQATQPSRLMSVDPIPATAPRLGTPDAPAGHAPALGPAKPELAAE
ncbi:MAG: DUF4177 domain-containing protein [Paracoccaceae bacterium]